MDKLGERIIRDTRDIARKRSLADQLERDAKQFRREADELERLLDLARQAQ